MADMHDPFAIGADWATADDDHDGIKNMEDKTPHHHSDELKKNGFDMHGQPLPGNPAKQLPDELPPQ